MTADRSRPQAGPRVLIAAAGTSRGIETRVVPEAGFRLHLLPILPLSRRLALETALAPGAAVAGTGAALRLLRRERIDVVAGMGGYVTLPVAAAARLAGVPVVLHESNAVPGLANRLAARFARRVALGVADAAAAFLPGRTVTVGNPVRPELARLDRSRLRELGRKELGLDPERSTLFAFGGSQGARHVNQALVAATPHWPTPERLQILHACGRRDEAEVREGWRRAAPGERGLQVRVEPFVERMDLAYAACDLALTRAGAMTMAELTAAGVPGPAPPVAPRPTGVAPTSGATGAGEDLAARALGGVR